MDSPKADKAQAKAEAKEQKQNLDQAKKAIKVGDIQQLKAILQAHPEIISLTARPGFFATAATAAVLSLPGSPAAGNGAPLAVAAGSGVTLLHDAAIYNRPDAVELLLSYHVDINARNGLGATPLHEAVNFLSIDVVRVLLEHGADVNTKWVNGETPLQSLRWARANRTRSQPLQKFNDIEALLLAHGAF